MFHQFYTRIEEIHQEPVIKHESIFVESITDHLKTYSPFEESDSLSAQTIKLENHNHSNSDDVSCDSDLKRDHASETETTQSNNGKQKVVKVRIKRTNRNSTKKVGRPPKAKGEKPLTFR